MNTSITYMISPSLSLVCISAQVLWSADETAARRRRVGRGEGGESSAAPALAAAAARRRTPGELPRRRIDAARPPTPPSILEMRKLPFRI